MSLYYDNMVKWLDYEAADKSANRACYGSDSETSNRDGPGRRPGPRGRPAAGPRPTRHLRPHGRQPHHQRLGRARSIFRTLHAGGRDDIIYDMVVNPTSPGYGNLVTSGHTTISESLNGSGSQTYHFLGQVDAWLVNGLAGINQAPDSVT